MYDTLLARYMENRESLRALWGSLPTSLFNGDESDPYFLTPDGHLAGYHCFLEGGLDVCVSQFFDRILSLDEALPADYVTKLPADTGLQKQFADGILRDLAVIGETYTFTETEVRAMPYLYRMYLFGVTFHYGAAWKTFAAPYLSAPGAYGGYDRFHRMYENTRQIKGKTEKSTPEFSINWIFSVCFCFYAVSTVLLLSMADVFAVVREESKRVWSVAVVAADLHVVTVAQRDVMLYACHVRIIRIGAAVLEHIVLDLHPACGGYIDTGRAAVDKAVIVDGQVRVYACRIVRAARVVRRFHDNRPEVRAGMEEAALFKRAVPDLHVVARTDFVPDLDVR